MQEELQALVEKIIILVNVFFKWKW